MFIVSTGRVDAVCGEGEKSVTVATFSDGDFFGEMAVLSGEPRTATVTAVKNTELLELSRENLHKIFSKHPEVEAKIRLAYDERGDERPELATAAPQPSLKASAGPPKSLVPETDEGGRGTKEPNDPVASYSEKEANPPRPGRTDSSRPNTFPLSSGPPPAAGSSRNSR